MTTLDGLTNEEILGLTIYGEARGESIEGQTAVGCVVRNRLTIGVSKYKSYHDVCLEPFQFSCWNSNDPNKKILMALASDLVAGRPFNDLNYQQCLFIALGIVNWKIKDNVNTARNYMTKSLFESDKRPGWAKNPIKVTTIGNHNFLLL